MGIILTALIILTILINGYRVRGQLRLIIGNILGIFILRVIDFITIILFLGSLIISFQSIFFTFFLTFLIFRFIEASETILAYHILVIIINHLFLRRFD